MKKWFVFLAVLAVVSVPASAAQLVVNGDFSTGDETGWTRWNSPWGGGFTWDASQGFAALQTSSGSFGWYQAIDVVQGAQYTINGVWMGNGSGNWCEVLFFNDDGRAIYDQCDAPVQGAIISKVSSTTNGGMPFKDYGGGVVDFGSITEFLCPVSKLGAGTNVITATGSKMYVVLKTGVGAGSTICWFDDITVEGPLVPEPASMLALVAGLGGLIIRRKR